MEIHDHVHSQHQISSTTCLCGDATKDEEVHEEEVEQEVAEDEVAYGPRTRRTQGVTRRRSRERCTVVTSGALEPNTAHAVLAGDTRLLTCASRVRGRRFKGGEVPRGGDDGRTSRSRTVPAQREAAAVAQQHHNHQSR